MQIPHTEIPEGDFIVDTTLKIDRFEYDENGDLNIVYEATPENMKFLFHIGFCDYFGIDSATEFRTTNISTSGNMYLITCDTSKNIFNDNIMWFEQLGINCEEPKLLQSGGIYTVMHVPVEAFQNMIGEGLQQIMENMFSDTKDMENL